MSGKTERTSFSRDVARRTALLTVGRFVSKLLVFFMVRLYTACLSPAEYSAADLIVDMANLLIPLASLGVSEGIFRNAANRNRDKEAYLTAGLAVLGAGSLAFLLLSPLLTCIPLFTGTAWLIVLYVLLANLHAVVSQYLFAVGRVRLFAGQGVLNTVLIIVLNILFLPVLKLGVTGYVMSTFIADGLTTLLLVLYTRLWRSVRRMSLRELWATAKPMLCFCLPLVPATLCWWITSVSDRYMIYYMRSAAENGLYTAAYKVPTILTYAVSIFSVAWKGSISAEDDDPAVWKRHYTRSWQGVYGCGVCGGRLSDSDLAPVCGTLVRGELPRGVAVYPGADGCHRAGRTGYVSGFGVLYRPAYRVVDGLGTERRTSESAAQHPADSPLRRHGRVGRHADQLPLRAGSAHGHNAAAHPLPAGARAAGTEHPVPDHAGGLYDRHWRGAYAFRVGLGADRRCVCCPACPEYADADTDRRPACTRSARQTARKGD
ncbi:MAG: lipopolysaccharide biosynthesis protein [Oscillospiraceae bacterium]|nr:MAG: lipopolysaccharide biosynthesis protein [Oscillospiraceae bacterium]